MEYQQYVGMWVNTSHT